MQTKKTLSFQQAFKSIFAKLQKKHHWQFWLLLMTMIMVALFETISLGVVALFASAITDPEITLESEYISFIRNYVSWSFLNEPRHLVIALGIVVSVVIPLKNIARGFITYWISHYSNIVETYFGRKLLNGFLSKEYQWLLAKNSADLILGIQWRNYLGTNFFGSNLKMLSDFVIVVFLLSALIIIKPVITFIILLLIGGVAYFIYFDIRSRLDLVTDKCAYYTEKINRNCTKAIHGVKEVKISSSKRYFINEFDDSALPRARYTAVQEFLSQIPTLLLESFGFFMLAGVVLIMIFLMESPLAVVSGTLTLLAVTAWRVLPAINRIVSGFTHFRISLPYIAIELDYLDQFEIEYFDEDRHKNTDNMIEFKEKIELNNISFKYHGDDCHVIKDLSLSIKQGETLGIIGPSGAGKSTIADLLIGLLAPDKGIIAVDEKTIIKTNLNSWLKHVGYVSQSPYIFDGTLAENVAFGLSLDQINRDKVLECCKMAAMDFLDQLTDGIDSGIGERGIRLSGGQQQRVAIARALYSNPDVLVFDEATSALDSKSEKAILQTIYGFKGKLTLIIIAHRLSTVEKCDRVAWLEKGVLRDVGAPKKIIKNYKVEMAGGHFKSGMKENTSQESL